MIRAWAIDNGISVPARGRIPGDVERQYKDAVGRLQQSAACRPDLSAACVNERSPVRRRRAPINDLAFDDAARPGLSLRFPATPAADAAPIGSPSWTATVSFRSRMRE